MLPWQERTFLSVLTCCPGFLIDYVSIDLMHVFDLGCLLIVLGNATFEVFTRLGGLVTRPEECLHEVVRLIHMGSKHLHQRRPPVNNLTMGMVRGKSGNPKLKVKAAEARHYLPCLVFVLENALKPRTLHETMVLDCLRCAANMYTELYAWTAASGPVVSRCARQFVMLFGELSREAAEGPDLGYVAWKFVPKFHLLVHCTEDQLEDSGNPTRHWCYMDEHEIGICVGIAESMHPSHHHRSVIEKYRCTV